MADIVTVEPLAPPQGGFRRARGARSKRDGLTALLFLLPNIIGFLTFTALPHHRSTCDVVLRLGSTARAKFNGLTNYKQFSLMISSVPRFEYCLFCCGKRTVAVEWVWPLPF